MNKYRLANFVVTLAAGLSLSGFAVAGPHAGESQLFVEAPVIDVEPKLRVVQITTPREVCWQEEVRRPAHGGYRSGTPLVLGGIIGGVIGNQFGGGSGKDILTAAGALLGASVGRDEAYRRQAARHSYVSLEERCEVEQVVHEEERLDGYRVTYEYGGQTFVTHTATDPGATIRVRVRVQPVTYNDRTYGGHAADWRQARHFRR